MGLVLMGGVIHVEVRDGLVPPIVGFPIIHQVIDHTSSALNESIWFGPGAYCKSIATTKSRFCLGRQLVQPTSQRCGLKFYTNSQGPQPLNSW